MTNTFKLDAPDATLHDGDRLTEPSTRFPTPSLLQAIRDAATHGDETANLVACHDHMVDDGLFHVLVPRELGGASGTATDWFDTSVVVAHADPSAGWIMSQGAVQNAWIAVAGDPDFAARFFSTRQTIASSAAGHATAERDGENFLVRDGRWAYTSGCQGAAYVGGMVRVPVPGGAIETLMVLAPAALATIENSWDTHGLRGTGSHDVNLGDQITIPASQTFTWPELTITRPGTLATAATHTRWLISTCAAAVNLGAARRALEVAIASAEHKQHRFETVPVAQQAPFIRAIAELHGSVELAISGLRQLLDQLWHRAELGAPPTANERARLRLAAAAAVTTGARVVHEATVLIGADALHRTHPLERLARDTQMLQHHIAVNSSTREQLGNVLFGSYQGPAAFI
jgi:alkylation response protein AidB-like acyl-CoA dehydrogenase